MDTSHQSILVVGAGIFGVAAALELRRRGYAVSLFDPGPLPHPDASSTDISKAIRMDYGSDELYMRLMEVALDRWDMWNQQWGEKLYHESGAMWMTFQEMRPNGYEYESYMLLKKRGHKPQRMDATSLKERFPAWASEAYPDGYYNARGGWAESGRVVERLIRQAEAEGVLLREGVKFERLLEEGSRVAGIMSTDGERHHADYVVVAAGAWTPTLLPHLGDVMWAVGQPVLHFRPDNPADYEATRFPVWGADISNTGWYGFPIKPDGTLKVANHGPGRRIYPDEPRVVAAAQETRFREFFKKTFPALVDAPLIGSRLCLYCDTWDGNFWIDHDPQREGLVVATGGSGHGFKFAPVLGEIVADVLERKPNDYAARFARRSRGDLTTEDARFSESS